MRLNMSKKTQTWNSQFVTKETKYCQNQKNPLKVNFFKFWKHHSLRIQHILGVMYLFCPKSPFPRVFLVLAAKQMSLFSTIYFCKKNPEIKILENVKTSSFRRKKRILMVMFLFATKKYFQGDFWFWQQMICPYLLLHF